MTNSSLDYALMAFDSYYRGDRPDIKDVAEIYNRILQNLPTDAIPAGFSASVYQTGGEIVISYRGTDFDEFLPLFDTQLWDDIMNGWVAGSGIAAARQVAMAIEFYQSVKSDHPNSTITLTGHSLGGGLAGMIGAHFLVGADLVFRQRDIQAPVQRIFDRPMGCDGQSS